MEYSPPLCRYNLWKLAFLWAFFFVAHPVFAESTTANTTISVTIQGAPASSASIGGGWNFRLKPGVFSVSDPIVIQLWTETYPPSLEEATAVYEESLRKNKSSQSSSSRPMKHPAAEPLYSEPIIRYMYILTDTDNLGESPITEIRQEYRSEGKQEIVTGKEQEETATPIGSNEPTMQQPQESDISSGLSKTVQFVQEKIWNIPSIDKEAAAPQSSGQTLMASIVEDPVRVWNTGMILLLLVLCIVGLRIILKGKVQKPWQMFNAFVVLLICSYGGLVLLEYVGATNMMVSFTVTNLSLSCEGAVELGTIAVTGNTGAYSSTRKTTCTIETSNPNGYTLQWKAEPISGGTGTGSLRSQNGDSIPAYSPSVSGTPETWSMSESDSEWGGRVSSTSTTMSSGVWGTDGASEKWMNVSTTGHTIVTRNSATGGSPDIENIGFTAEVGSSKAQPAGTYQARIVFTAITN